MVVAFSLLLAAADPSALVVLPETTEGYDAPDGAKGVRAVFVVHESAEAVAELLWQGQYVRAIFPEVKQRTLTAQESADAVLVDYVADGGFSDFRYQVRFRRERRLDGSVAVRWDKVKGDMGVVRGAWTLTPLAPDYCRAEYTSFASLGPAFLDGFVRDGLARSTAGLAERVRRSVADAAAKARAAEDHQTKGTSARRPDG